jgi:hypothetical protein
VVDTRREEDMMQNLESLLNEDELLLKISTFDLQRENEHLHIDVHECLSGSAKGKFFAVPNLFIIHCKNESYIGKGDSTEEALKDCLKKIKEVSFDEILPNKK